ncbi:helix-turn-helix transcriptional regulator [Actinoplanes sp. NPDC051851]|uniref:helix-turn-helix domain-containing protein n=1 Tax=Actinoplanes sp. NPDC051851 TaxID=3154753 RepID=UPI003413F292
MRNVPVRKVPTVKLRRLTAELKRLRIAAGVTIDDVVKQTGIDQSSVYRIERALNKPQRRTVTTLLALYHVDDQRRETLLTWLKESDQQDWLQAYEPYLPEQYQAYVGFEYEAERLSNYEPLFVPGLLQTADYARAVIEDVGQERHFTPEEVQKRLDVRRHRQSILHRPAPLQLYSVIDEAAIRRTVGGPEIMRAQIQHLAKVSAASNVTLRIVPFSAGAYPGMTGPFTVMYFTDPFDAPLVYAEGVTGNAFLERENDVARFADTFEFIAGAALSVTQSRKLLQEIAKTA